MNLRFLLGSYRGGAYEIGIPSARHTALKNEPKGSFSNAGGA